PAEPAARHAQLFQAVIRAREGGRAWAAERFWQQALTLVPGAGGQLCGTEARPAHGRDPLLAGQAAVLGRGLVRAPLRLARRPGPHGHNIVLMNLTTGSPPARRNHAVRVR